MNSAIREAIDAIVTHSRPAVCHSERVPGCVALDRTFARESGVGQSVARSMGGAAP